MTIVVDIDGVLCREEAFNYLDYSKCIPIKENIRLVNRLYRLGHHIILHSARWGEDEEITAEWLSEHGVRYHELVLGKPKGDYYVDDRHITLAKMVRLVDET